MKQLLMLLMLTSLLLVASGGTPVPNTGATETLTSTDTSTPTNTPEPTNTPTSTPTPAVGNHFQGWAPGVLGLAITSDGKKSYISFELDDALLVVDLSTFTIINSIDVSAAGNQLFSGPAILSPDGKKLYVSNCATENIMVINTESNSVEEVLPLQPICHVALTTSLDGSKVYIPSVDGGLYIVNAADNSYHRIFIPGVIFGPVAPSPDSPDLLYTVGTLIDQGNPQPSFFTFDTSSDTVVRSSSLTDEVSPPHFGVRRLVVNSTEAFAYFGWLRFDDRGFGNFTIFDLDSFQVLESEPIENGVADFAVNEQTGKAYIIGFWAGGGSPNELPILEWDISTNEVVRRIPVSPSSDQRAIAIDPTDADYLYMTEGDWNLIRKVEISTGKEISRLYFSRADIRPCAITVGDDNIGYIRSHHSSTIYQLDLNSGNLVRSFQLPYGISGGAGGGYYRGNLYFSDPETIYSIDPSDGSIIESYRLDTSITPICPITFAFFNDTLAFIDFPSGNMVGQRLLILDANNMALLKSIELPPEPHGDKVVVSPDGSKLYIARGLCHGTATITILDASTYEILNTIEIPFTPLVDQSGGATSFVEGDFDETNRILYLTGFVSVYKIDMDTDQLIGILDLEDVYESLGTSGWSPAGLSGVVLSTSKDKLFVISADAHSMYTYDLINSSWMTKITNLRGYSSADAVYSPDRRYLYTINNRTDNVTMVNLTSGDVEKVIDLHACPTETATPTPTPTPTVTNTVTPTPTSSPTVTPTACALYLPVVLK